MSLFNKKPQSIKDIDHCLDADCNQYYTKNSAAFTFLTEDIDMFSRVDMNGKNILAVAAGSGDAMLAMRARGPRPLICLTCPCFQNIQPNSSRRP